MVIQKASAFDFPTYQLFINSAFVPSDRFLTARVDRSIGSIFQRMRVGKASFDLDNEHQDFSPARYFDMGGVSFEGNSQQLHRGSDLTSNADGSFGTFACVFRDLGNFDDEAFLLTSHNLRVRISRKSNGALSVTLRNPSNVDVLRMDTVDFLSTEIDGRYHHFAAAWDLVNSIGQLMVDGQITSPSFIVGPNSAQVDYTDVNYGIGGRTANNNQLWRGEIAHVYLNVAEFHNLASETNARKLISQHGQPIDHGLDGSLVTGSNAIIAMDFPQGSEGTNGGYGGDFTTLNFVNEWPQYRINAAPFDLRPGKSISARAIEGPLHLPFVSLTNSHDYLQQSSDFAGNMNGPSGMVHGYFRVEQLTNSFQYFFANDTSRFAVIMRDNNKFRVSGLNESAGTALDMVSSNAITAGSIHHFLAAWDIVNSYAALYIDDKLEANELSSTINSGHIDYTNDTWRFGLLTPQVSINTRLILADIYDFWFDNTSGQVLDINSESNRRKYVTADLRPVDLGLFGELPLGFRPLAYFTFEDNDNIGHNLGTGANSGVHFTDQRTTQTNNGVHQLFTGKMDRFDVEPILGKQATKVTASDVGDLFRDRINIPFKLNTSVASLSVEIGSAIGVSSTDVSTVPFNDVIPFADLDDVSGGSALDDILNTGAHRAFITAKNIFKVQHRNASQFTTAVLSASQFFDLTYRLSDDGLINKARVTGQPRKRSTETKTIAFLEDSPTLAQSQTFSFDLEFMDFATNERGIPVTSPITPVKSLDYLLTIGEDGDPAPTSSAIVSLEIFARSAKVSVTNVEADPAILASFGIRGVPIERRSKFRMVSESSSSQNIFGEQEFEIENDLIGSTLFARAYAEWLVFQYDDPLADISVTFRSEFGSNECLALELDDRIHLTESHTMIKSLFNVTGIKHTIRPNIVHNTAYEVSLVLDKPYLILDDLNLGTIDSTNILGF